jgi:lysophospholipase L1-like esterase
MMLIGVDDPRLAFFAPQPVDRAHGAARMERFPPSAYAAVLGKIGPTANLRSSPGCAVVVTTDSPVVDLQVTRLRHHQLAPVGFGCEVEAGGKVLSFASEDLRERDGDLVVSFATGLERGREPATVWLWMPLISTCAITGVGIADGSLAAGPSLPEPRWLAIGDSLTQGFSVQAPTQCWVHRLSRRWRRPVWNLGVGGLGIEPEVFSWALERTYDLVTISLGSNHAWRDSEVEAVPTRARALIELVLARPHGRVAWTIPPYKPFEEGKGPADFAGVPLDAEATRRISTVRRLLVETLSEYRHRVTLVHDLLPHDHRLYPDGLHPFALGMAHYADALAAALTLD